jgi:hypothetical protein
MKGSTNEHGAIQNTINSIKKQENFFQNTIVNVKVKGILVFVANIQLGEKGYRGFFWKK